MASPYGLAYGIGAGIAGAQQQMQSRQQAAVQMAMANMQMKEAQRQEQEREAMNQALVAPVQPEMRSVPVYETQETPAAFSAPGVPFGDKTIPTQVQTGIRQEPVGYATPYQKMAYETAQRAQMLRSRGLGITAMKLDEQAMQFADKHRDTALRMAGQAIGGGSPQSAVPLLNSVGFGVQNIEADPDDPESLLITREDGSVGSISRNAGRLLAADPTKAAEIEGMINYRQTMGGARVQAEETRALQAEIARLRLAADERLRGERNRIMAEANQIRRELGRSKPGSIGSINAQIFDKFLARNPGDPDAALQEYRDFQVSMKDYKTPKEKAAAVVARMEPLDAGTRQKNLEIYEDMFSKASGEKREQKRPASGIAEPKSKEEYDRLPSGTKYRKDGKTYIKG